MGPTMEQFRALGKLRKTMFVWQMNYEKARVKPETKERLWRDVEAAIHDLSYVTFGPEL